MAVAFAATAALAAGPSFQISEVFSNADGTVQFVMLARGYIAEGYGPTAVSMCSPI
jgi:hypothetical protein